MLGAQWEPYRRCALREPLACRKTDTETADIQNRNQCTAVNIRNGMSNMKATEDRGRVGRSVGLMLRREGAGPCTQNPGRSVLQEQMCQGLEHRRIGLSEELKGGMARETIKNSPGDPENPEPS